MAYVSCHLQHFVEEGELYYWALLRWTWAAVFTAAAFVTKMASL